MKNKNTPKKYSNVHHNIWYALKLFFSASPVYGISVVIEALRHNLVNFLEHTFCVFIVLDTIEHGKPFSRIIIVIGIFIIVDFIAVGISTLYEQYIKIRFLPIAQKKLKQQLFEKAREVDIMHYDNADYYNDYVMVISESDKVIERAEQITRMIAGSVTILICYGAFFISQDVLSVLFVIISFVLRTIFSNISNKINYELKCKSIPLERKRDYIRRLFYLKDYAKEIRLNKSVTENFHNQFDAVNDEMYELQKKIVWKKFIFDFLAKYVSSDFLLDIVYVIYLILKVSLFHILSFSSVVVLYNSAAGLRRGLSLIADLGPFTVETSLYIEKIRTFLDTVSSIKNCKKREIPKGPKQVRFENVSFGYDTNKLILKNISLQIDIGEKIALVGYNGAGKTTLIKLLLRLYDPVEGRILLDGHDSREYDIDEYRKYMGVVFQDFQIYAASVRENIVMDTINDTDEAVNNVIRDSGFSPRFTKMDKGLDTQLTCEFDDSGTDLSGGEEQKLVIARALYKDANILLLDEPSSALDPIAEYQLNNTMENIGKNKMVVFISHRLSTTRKANRIYVLNKGKIAEEGSHDSLLKKGSIYSDMWNAQAGKYLRV